MSTNSYATRLLVSAIATILLAVTGNLIYRHCNLAVYDSFQKNERLFNSQIGADVLLLGSSRMYYVVNPRHIEDTLHLKTYNAGMQAANINETLIILRSYLDKNPPPRLVVMALDIFSMDDRQQFGFYPTYLYNADNAHVRKALRKEGAHPWLLTNPPFLTSTEFDDFNRGVVVKYLLRQRELSEGSFKYNGYASNTIDTIQSESAYNPTPAYTLPTAWRKLDEVLSICKQHGILVILTYAPEYNGNNLKNVSNSDSILHGYANYAAKYGAPFLRHDSLPMCKDGRLFANPGHVNRYGAEVYSAILASQIKSLYPNLVNLPTVAD